MTREEAIGELQEDKRLYETEVCHAGDGSPDGRLLEALDMAIEALSDEPKKGEWKPTIKFIQFTCSECGAECSSDYNYCPNCGAKMYKGGDDE